ncbi:unnamed protein product [Discosporangium mesarthrocarpum]
MRQPQATWRLLLLFLEVTVVRSLLSVGHGLPRTLHCFTSFHWSGRGVAEPPLSLMARRAQDDGISSEEVPRLVVMDLDYTMWKPELFQMRGSPYSVRDGKVRDCKGTVIDLFPGVREILLDIHTNERFSETRVAAASRTEHPTWAREVMDLMDLGGGVRMADVFDLAEVYPGSKIRHFGKLRKDSRVPYEDMIFFDDWDVNCAEVERLGVMSVECPTGLNKNVWKRGLEEYAARKRAGAP